MLSSDNITARALLTNGMTPYEIKINGRLIDSLHERFERAAEDLERDERTRERRVPRKAREQWRADNRRGLDRRRPEHRTLRRLVDYLRAQVEHELWQLNALIDQDANFRRTLANVDEESLRRDLILQHASHLGANDQQLKDDQAAFDRWFGADAIADRFLKARGEQEQRLAFTLQRLGVVLYQLGDLADDDPRDGPAIWKRMDGEGMLRSVLKYAGDVRVPLAALQCVRRFMESLSATQRSQIISDRTYSYLMQSTSDPQVATWLQCESLSVIHLSDPIEAGRVIAKRLQRPQAGDDMFVRRHALRMLVAFDGLEQERGVLFAHVASDSSPFVRQQLAELVWKLPPELGQVWIEHFAFEETHPQVRAMMLAAALQHASDAHQPALLKVLPRFFRSNEDTFVLRTALHVAECWLARLNRPVDSNSTDQSSASDPTNLSAVSNEAAASAERWKERRDKAVQSYIRTIVPLIRQLQASADSLQVRRWSATTAESIWLLLDDQARTLHTELHRRMAGTGPGDSCRLPASLFEGIDPTVVGRTLAVMAQKDFGFDLQQGWFGYRLVRGPVFGVRAWRVWYELTRSATDKRQAFRHTIGRISDATLRAPSQIMGELSLTKVPGEPFLDPDEGSWRPYLPLADDYLSVLGVSWLRSREVRFFTSQGITTVQAPWTPWGKLRAWFSLTRKFAKYAHARNWSESRSATADEYVAMLTAIGFKTRFETYADSDSKAPPADDSVTRFFPALLLAFGLPDVMIPLWNIALEYASYFSAAYENNIHHLLIFGLLFALLFVVKHVYSNATYHRARQSIPLSLGGWGTRGKSGTERLKAALIAEMGHGMVSKTTGCEAMFIQSHAFGDQLEIPLFRPYDKATIWEQRDLMRLASRLTPSVFLWECMALTPSYVDVLQRQWTKDDLSTVTNTYPDHEDLQGPAGYNVAQTISGFVPRQATVITTEQEMRPIVRHSCEEVDSHLRSVGWLESGLITDDVLDRFPYKEHPDNIALVAAMADELGVPYDFAVKAMADHLVPDLGVLKTYPVSTIRKRQIEFTNGMSANERFGCLGNWSRLGYDQHDANAEPQTWISTVVNNRADRVARSRVFASILVNDVSADRHFLIGTNLDGFAGFVREELEATLSSSTLATGDSFDAAAAAETFKQAAIRYRQPTDAAHVQDGLELIISSALANRSVGSEPKSENELKKESAEPEHQSLVDSACQRWDEPGAVREMLSAELDEEMLGAIEQRQEWQVRALKEYSAFVQNIHQTTAATAAQLDNEFRSLLRTWFERKLIVVESPETTGEQIIERIVHETPPGVRNRVMGVQNIKGTGMDFIYRFQAWDACYEACQQVRQRDHRAIKKGLEALCEFPQLGQLCERELRSTIEFAHKSTGHQLPEYTTMLEQIESSLRDSLSSIRSNFGAVEEEAGQPGSSWLDWTLAKLEELLDVNDAARRRELADTIYRDLGNGRISRQRAVAELRKINKRQKGGWLTARFRSK